MRLLGVAAVGGLSAVLVATLLMHYQSARPEDTILPRPASNPSPVGTVRPTPAADAEIQANVDRILARPLFNPDRRPGAAAAAQATAAADLPRLSAVLVSGRGRAVIFAGPGKPVTLSEGGRIGGYTVQSIGAGQVTLLGPDGTHVLHPLPDRAAAPPVAAASTQPNMLDLLRQNPLVFPGPPVAAPAPPR